MNGRQEVVRLRQKLDATFKRAAGVGTDTELQSDFARYLCVLVSGFLETAVAEMVLEHCRTRSAPSVQRFVETKTRRFQNPKAQRIYELFGSFDPDWRRDLEGFLVDEKRDAVDSVVNLRNRIAHGDSVGVTYYQVNEYYRHIQVVIDYIADLCDPP